MRRRGVRGKRLIKFIQPAADLVAGVRRQPGKLECRDMAAVFQTNDNRFPINPGSSIQRKGKGNLLGLPKRDHGAERKPVLREVSHHPAVGGRKFDVDEAQRAFSKLRSTLGFHGHGNTC